MSERRPRLSVIVLNYNGSRWLDRCVGSLRGQTVISECEVIIADNLSTDGSDHQAAALMQDFPGGRFMSHGTNLGFCEGNNRAARAARGEWLFFLNNDTWLEPDCLEKLLTGAQQEQVDAAMPVVLNYADDSFQSLGVRGFDCFGWGTHFSKAPTGTTEIFAPNGCAYLIREEVFWKLGGFDPEFFMYADELDLSFRLWVTGFRAVALPVARLHHRGAANVNPKGDGSMVELRTSDSTRFYSNRNSLLTLLKSAQHLLLLLVPMQVLLLLAEGLVGWAVTRRWSFVRRAYLGAVLDCWKMRSHWLAERRRIRPLRRRGDLWMLRMFFTWVPQRWDEFQRVRRMGLPKVSAR